MDELGVVNGFMDVSLGAWIDERTVAKMNG